MKKLPTIVQLKNLRCEFAAGNINSRILHIVSELLLQHLPENRAHRIQLFPFAE